jgi:hypothetical protein
MAIEDIKTTTVLLLLLLLLLSLWFIVLHVYAQIFSGLVIQVSIKKNAMTRWSFSFDLDCSTRTITRTRTNTHTNTYLIREASFPGVLNAIQNSVSAGRENDNVARQDMTYCEINKS